MVLSKKSEKILRKLRDKEKEFEEMPDDKKGYHSSKVTYNEIKGMFPKNSHISLAMILKYLLEEKFIYNHIAGKENTFDIEDLENDKLKLVIGEKGISYLENKKYVLYSKIIPLATAVLGLAISFYNLFVK
ncbi:hypothetical protein QCD87_13305 [Staphylococcus aureus]|nr:hypothetical protein [Staphylococcus aureus]